MNTQNVLTETIYGKMFVPATDTGVGLALQLAGEFCYQEQLNIAPYIQDDAVVLDVGANLGIFSLFVARRIDPLKGYVIGFEPQPYLHRLCIANAVVNNLNHCHFINTAIHSTLSRIPFPEIDYSVPANFGSLCVREQSAGTGATTTIECTRLDALDLPRLNLVKIDVEDAIEDTFLSGQKLFEKHLPVMHLEGNRNDSPLKQWLRSKGYRLFHELAPIARKDNFKGSTVMLYGNYVQQNFVAIPPHIHVYPTLKEF
jgi:FkbM family methyltransferase